MNSRASSGSIVPCLRGYGPTSFRDPGTLRSSQRGALGDDLLSLMDGLNVRRGTSQPTLGGRAYCIVAALWPERVAGLVSITGYNIQNIATALQPASPDAEYRYWYQWYFHTECGRDGLSANRRPFCRKLWELWSPNYRFDDAEYERTAKSFDNPDFSEVVIHSYRHRYGVAEGDPAFEHIEVELAKQPVITVPTIVLHGESDGVSLPQSPEHHDRFFTGAYQRRIVPDRGTFPSRWPPPSSLISR